MRGPAYFMRRAGRVHGRHAVMSSSLGRRARDGMNSASGGEARGRRRRALARCVDVQAIMRQARVLGVRQRDTGGTEG